MFRKNQSPTNRVDLTYYPLTYMTKLHPDYHYNRRNISAYVANITFDAKGSSPDVGRTFHVVAGEETHHSALCLIHNKGDYYRYHTPIDTLNPPTRAVIEGWTNQNRDAMTSAFANTEVSDDTPKDTVKMIIDNLRLSVLALGVTMARLDRERKFIANRRPLRGHFELPTMPAIESHYLTDDTKRLLSRGSRRAVSATLNMPTEKAARLIDLG